MEAILQVTVEIWAVKESIFDQCAVGLRRAVQQNEGKGETAPNDSCRHKREWISKTVGNAVKRLTAEKAPGDLG